MASVNIWGTSADRRSIDIDSINSRLNSKVDKNGDEMHGDFTNE